MYCTCTVAGICTLYLVLCVYSLVYVLGACTIRQLWILYLLVLHAYDLWYMNYMYEYYISHFTNKKEINDYGPTSVEFCSTCTNDRKHPNTSGRRLECQDPSSIAWWKWEMMLCVDVMLLVDPLMTQNFPQVSRTSNRHYYTASREPNRGASLCPSILHS